MAAVLSPVPVAGPIVPGLERLIQLATVDINQTSSGYQGNNYTVLSNEECLFTMNEEVPDSIFRGGAHREFIFDGVENTGRKVFRFLRPVGHVFMLNTVDLFIDGQLACIIRKEDTFNTPVFTIRDIQEQPVIRLKAKKTENTTFELQTMTKAPIGGILKTQKWRGWKEELFTYNDNFTINFPADLAVPYKLAVIVACVYIDFTFYEGK